MHAGGRELLLDGLRFLKLQLCLAFLIRKLLHVGVLVNEPSSFLQHPREHGECLVGAVLR